jgi:predicted ATP-binding protein involved in virulence
MRLDRIELQNYRCYQNFQAEFRPGFNVIAGVNGSGKTSLLKGIREALASLTIHMYLPHGNLGVFAGEDTIRIRSTEVSGGRYRFEPQFPVRVKAVGEVFGQAFAWTNEKDPASQRETGQAPGQIWKTLEQANGTAPPLTLPIVAFYPAYRQWPPARPNEMGAASERSSRMDGYRHWWEASSDSAGLQQWGIAKSMERLQFASDQSAGWNAIDSDELALVNVALAAVVEGVKGLRYDFTQKSLLIEWNGDTSPTAFENLSDGQRVAIALVADIARRMCLLNPHLGLAVTQQTPGVVLIDELDVHLHPKWQRLVTKGLSSAFPRVQFIVASHSPQVLGELQPDEILLLHPDGTAHPQVSYGLDSSRVLEQIMGASPRSTRVNEDLSALFESIERNELTHARKLLMDLKVSAPGIPELAGAEALLKRKEVVGR